MPSDSCPSTVVSRSNSSGPKLVFSIKESAEAILIRHSLYTGHQFGGVLMFNRTHESGSAIAEVNSVGGITLGSEIHDATAMRSV